MPDAATAWSVAVNGRAYRLCTGCQAVIWRDAGSRRQCEDCAASAWSRSDQDISYHGCCICGTPVLIRESPNGATRNRLDRTCPGDCHYLLKMLRHSARRVRDDCPVCGRPYWPRRGPRSRCHDCGGPAPETVRLPLRDWRSVITRMHPGCRRDLIDRVRVRDGLPPIPEYLDSKETADV